QNEGVVERPAAHVCQGCDFDDLPLHVVPKLFVWDHVVERVVYGSKIGVDLFLEIAGQKAQVLSCFYSGTGDDDFLDRLIFERLYGKGYRYIGFASTRRAKGKHKVICCDEINEFLLIYSLRPNRRTLATENDDIVKSAGTSVDGRLLFAGDILLYVLFRDPAVFVIMFYQGIQDIVDPHDLCC